MLIYFAAIHQVLGGGVSFLPTPSMVPDSVPQLSPSSPSVCDDCAANLICVYLYPQLDFKGVRTKQQAEDYTWFTDDRTYYSAKCCCPKGKGCVCNLFSQGNSDTDNPNVSLGDKQETNVPSGIVKVFLDSW